MNRQQAIQHARDHALASGSSTGKIPRRLKSSPSYLPKTPEEAKGFQPHEWVISAILDVGNGLYAENQRLREALELVRNDMQHGNAYYDDVLVDKVDEALNNDN